MRVEDGNEGHQEMGNESVAWRQARAQWTDQRKSIVICSCLD